MNGPVNLAPPSYLPTLLGAGSRGSSLLAALSRTKSPGNAIPVPAGDRPARMDTTEPAPETSAPPAPPANGLDRADGYTSLATPAVAPLPVRHGIIAGIVV